MHPQTNRLLLGGISAGLVSLAALAPIPDVAAESGGKRFAVASENDAATRAAMTILGSGGTAVDAAIAASAMLGVTAPVSCGIGGGGFALVYDATARTVSVLDYRETAPLRHDAAACRKQRSACIGVPGEVAGLAELQRRWGTRSFAENLAPAVRAAREGFVVSRHLASAIGASSEFLTNPLSPALFAPAGTPAKEGERITNRALAATLERIGAEGARAFYEGPVASELAQIATGAGSLLDVAELANYHVMMREPLRARWEGYDVATMPPPSAGGLLLLETLGLYSATELTKMGWGSADLTHLLAESMRGAIADRMRAVGDPAFVADRSTELLAPDRLKARRARLDRDRTHAPPRFELIEHGTTHLVVVDDKGNVVSLTTTINSPFGSGVIAPRSGVLLNDELSDFTDPTIAAKFGALPGPNQARPGARPVSSMTPTIVLRDGAPVLAIGGSGGLRIAGNVTQALLCRLAFGKSAQSCVEAPRFFTPPTGPTLAYNAGQDPPPDVALDLQEKGEQIRVIPGADGTAVQMITFERGPALTLRVAADPRKGGLGLAE